MYMNWGSQEAWFWTRVHINLVTDQCSACVWESGLWSWAVSWTMMQVLLFKHDPLLCEAPTLTIQNGASPPPPLIILCISNQEQPTPSPPPSTTGPCANRFHFITPGPVFPIFPHCPTSKHAKDWSTHFTFLSHTSAPPHLTVLRCHRPASATASSSQRWSVICST